MALSQRGHTYISPTVTADGRAHFGDVYGDVTNNCLCTQVHIYMLLLIQYKMSALLMVRPVQRNAGEVSFSPTLRSTVSASLTGKVKGWRAPVNGFLKIQPTNLGYGMIPICSGYVAVRAKARR